MQRTLCIIKSIIVFTTIFNLGNASFAGEQIEITSKVVKSKLDPYAYTCVNWEMNYDQHSFRTIFSNQEHYRDFIKFLKNDVSLKTFRYPGGTYVENFFPGVPAAKWFPVYKSHLKGNSHAKQSDWIEVEEFLKFLKDGDFRTFLQVNTFQWFDAEAGQIKPICFKSDKSQKYLDRIDPKGLKHAADGVEWLARCVKEKGYDKYVCVWEIGNEEYFFYTSDVYGKIADVFSKRIKKILPNAKIIITGQYGKCADDHSNKWAGGVVKYLKDAKAMPDIIGLTTHTYTFSAPAPKPPVYLYQSTAYQEYAAYVTFLPDDPIRHPWFPIVDEKGKNVSVIEQMREMMRRWGIADKTIWFTEYRLGGIFEPYSKALANAIGTLRLLGGFVAAPGVGGACFHSLLHGGHVGKEDSEIGKQPAGMAGYYLIYYLADRDAPRKFVGTPVAESFNLIWKLAQGDVLQTNCANDMIFAVATKDDKKLRLLLINKAAKPKDAEDVFPNKWGWENCAKQLIIASNARGDRFPVSITIPNEFKVSTTVKVFSLGENESLDAYSVTPGTYGKITEVKIKTGAVEFNGSKLNYVLLPHSAAMFEFELK